MTLNSVDDTVREVPRTKAGNVVDWRQGSDGKLIYVDPDPQRHTEITAALRSYGAGKKCPTNYYHWALEKATARLNQLFPLQED